MKQKNFFSLVCALLLLASCTQKIASPQLEESVVEAESTSIPATSIFDVSLSKSDEYVEKNIFQQDGLVVSSIVFSKQSITLSDSKNLQRVEQTILLPNSRTTTGMPSNWSYFANRAAFNVKMNQSVESLLLKFVTFRKEATQLNTESSTSYNIPNASFFLKDSDGKVVEGKVEQSGIRFETTMKKNSLYTCFMLQNATRYNFALKGCGGASLIESDFTIMLDELVSNKKIYKVTQPIYSVHDTYGIGGCG